MGSGKRTVAVVTGSRAEFGLLAPVMRAIRGRRGLDLRVVAAGQHLTTGTWRDIPGVGFEIDARVAMQRRGEVGRRADAAALGRGVSGFARVFEELKPGVVVVLGDRIEAFAAASAAAVGGVRVGHIHGGDRAEGVADESMRHAISKLAHVHFCATEGSRRRLIRMGEAAARVHVVGSPAIDGLSNIEPMGDRELAKLGLDPGRPFVVVLQHPIGEADDREGKWMGATLEAVDGVAREMGLGAVVFEPNGDPGSKGIRGAIERFLVRKRGREGWVRIAHLPRMAYVALLRRAGALVGNSSGGLIEASVIRTVGGIRRRGGVVGTREIAGLPVVNIGPRQSGRERAGNVLECGYGKSAVREALIQALGRRSSRGASRYGAGDAGRRIARLLVEMKWESIPLRKRNAF